MSACSRGLLRGRRWARAEVEAARSIRDRFVQQSRDGGTLLPSYSIPLLRLDLKDGGREPWTLDPAET